MEIDAISIGSEAGVYGALSANASYQFVFASLTYHRHNYDVQEYMDRVESNDGEFFPFAFVGGAAAAQQSKLFTYWRIYGDDDDGGFARISIRCHRSISKQRDFIPATQTEHIIVRSLVDAAIRKFVVEIRSRRRSLPSLSFPSQNRTGSSSGFVLVWVVLMAYLFVFGRRCSCFVVVAFVLNFSIAHSAYTISIYKTHDDIPVLFFVAICVCIGCVCVLHLHCRAIASYRASASGCNYTRK